MERTKRWDAGQFFFTQPNLPANEPNENKNTDQRTHSHMTASIDNRFARYMCPFNDMQINFYSLRSVHRLCHSMHSDWRYTSVQQSSE